MSSLSKNLPETPYAVVFSEVPSNNKSSHIYIVDASGRKIAAIWGPATQKLATATLFTLAPDLLRELRAARALISCGSLDRAGVEFVSSLDDLIARAEGGAA